VQPDASKRTEVVQPLGGVQSQQQIDRHLKVEAAKLIRPPAFKEPFGHELRHDAIMAHSSYAKW
jgi:hypothetical protein